MGVEIAPLAYVFTQIIYIIIARHISMYDVSDTAIEAMIYENVTGFISFDKKMHFLGCNRVAEDIFPEIAELKVDKTIKKSSKLSEIFSPWVAEFKKDNANDKFYYRNDENTYLVDINAIFYEGSEKGYQFLITDDTKNQKYIRLLNNYNSDLEAEVKLKTENIVKMHNNLVKSMAVMVESRDNSTGGHIIRTSDVVEILMEEILKDEDFVKEFNITERFKENIIKAAPLHDIGKIAVDDKILRKPARFDNDEFEKMKKHAPEGAKVLHTILEGTEDEEFKRLAENVAHYHHERMDGSGYPEGLKGDEIPVEARIMAVADVYDALVSKRVYKESMSFEKADSIMMESMGKHFDKRLEKFYLAAREKMEQYYRDR